MKDQKDLGADAAEVALAGSIASDAAPHAATVECPYCYGEGADVDAEQVQTGAHSSSWVGSISKCSYCDGTGRVPKCPNCVKGLQPSTHLDDEQPMRLCSTCDGSGVIENEDQPLGEASGSVPSAAQEKKPAPARQV